MKIKFIEKSKKTHFSGKHGFTLIEVVVAIGIFVIIASASSAAFTAMFGAYKGARNLNENLKNSQHAMNLINKTLRTSTVISPSADGESSTVTVYDFSQGECFKYDFTGTSLYESRGAVVMSSGNYTCPSLGSMTKMTSGVVEGRFNVIRSVGSEDSSGPVSEKVGRITTAMKISNGEGTYKKIVNLQSTVSLRDYDVSNIGIDVANPL
jgi:prepilin-type N-terminal cleavage/methylation domain-containing protein